MKTFVCDIEQDIPDLTGHPQAVFDYAVRHFRTQREACTGYDEQADDFVCKYRDCPTGPTLCCIVGAFIPDDRYDPTIEQFGVHDLQVSTDSKIYSEMTDELKASLRKFRLAVFGTTDWDPKQIDVISLLRSLQAVHDDIFRFDEEDLHETEFNLKALAEKYQLHYTPPEEAA